MSLGFILFRKPSLVPRMVELLSESYNPHVRYSAAMALGITCAGTGLDGAIDLLEPMMKDPTDFVRQGALMALYMIIIQQNEVMNPKVAAVRATLKKILTDRHEDAMTKFGCSLAMRYHMTSEAVTALSDTKHPAAMSTWRLSFACSCLRSIGSGSHFPISCH